MIVVRMLLNSWATLDARAPTLLSRWACRSCWRRASVSSIGTASISGPGMGSSPGRASSLGTGVTVNGIGRAEVASSSELRGRECGVLPEFSGIGSRAGSSAGGPHLLRVMGAAHLVRDVSDPPGPPGPPGPEHLADRGVREPAEPGPVGRIIPVEDAHQDHAND